MAPGPDEFIRVEKGKKRGQIQAGKRIVPAFPSIGRIYHLEAGLRTYGGVFHIEEKLDGFNARYFRHQGQIHGLTRGGFLCPFLNDRTDLVDPRFFDHHPGWVLYGEIVGRANPYLSECHLPVEDVEYFVFAVADERGRFLPPGERYSLLEGYRMRTVRHFGLFRPREIESLREIINELTRDEREGIVIKDASGGRPSRKYVTPFSDLNDLRHLSALLGETSPGYFTERIQRLLAHCWEFGNTSHLDHLGDAFRPALEGFGTIQRGGKVSERYAMNVHRRETAEAFRHFIDRSQQIEIHPVSLETRDNGFWHFVFERHYPKATGRLRRMVGGRLFYD